MSKIDDSTRLLHMRDAAIEAIRFAADQSRENLDSNRMLTLALVKEISGGDSEARRQTESGS